MNITDHYPKKIFFFILLVFFSSCKENKKHLLTKKSTYEHIDFSSTKDEDSLELKEYDYFYGNIVLDDSPFSIILVDFNQNNQFNDCEDIILIDTPINTDNTELNNINFTNYIKSNKLFSIDDKVFSIKSILKKNSFYEIELSKENVEIDVVPIQNRMISKLPEIISYENINNDKVNILNKNKKFIYIEFWSTSCSPCLELLPKIKNLNDQHSELIEVHSIAVINNRNTKEQIYTFLNENKDLSWNFGFSNNTLESKLRFGRLPMGYLFDTNGNLLIFDATPQKIENFLLKNNFKK
ncbi:TlpA family protein disulfide reductase [Paenimyroides ceti]